MIQFIFALQKQKTTSDILHSNIVAFICRDKEQYRTAPANPRQVRVSPSHAAWERRARTRGVAHVLAQCNVALG